MKTKMTLRFRCLNMLFSMFVFMCLPGSLPAEESREVHEVWTGTWSSTYGQLRLVQDGRRVYGDYANRGYLEGRTAENDPGMVRGTFQRKDGKWGFFEFTLSPDPGAFKGGWTYGENWESNDFPTDESTAWNGTKKTDIPGPIVQAVGKRFYWATVYDKNFPEDTLYWFHAKLKPVEEEKEPAPVPPDRTEKPHRDTPKVLPENYTVRVRIYGIEGQFRKAPLDSLHWRRAAITGSFYVSAWMVDQQGNRTRIKEKNGLAEMVWKRDIHNTHALQMRNWGLEEFKPEPKTVKEQSLSEWEQTKPSIRNMKSSNFFKPPLIADFSVSREQLENPDNLLRIQVSGYIFDVKPRSKESPRGKSEEAWVFQKHPLKRSGEVKSLVWNPGQGDDGVTWSAVVAVSFID